MNWIACFAWTTAAGIAIVAVNVITFRTLLSTERIGEVRKLNANPIDYQEWLISTDPFWRAYPLAIDTVIVANGTGGATTVRKCGDADQERIEPPTPNAQVCASCGVAFKTLYQAADGN